MSGPSSNWIFFKCIIALSMGISVKQIIFLSLNPLRNDVIMMVGRVLARILEISVQNSNFKIYSHPDVATQM